MSKIVNLYGHLIIDKIFVNSSSQESLGGIANVWYALSMNESSYNVRLLPSAIGEAVVVVDTDCNQRVGRAILNKKKYQVNPTEAHWHHIAYINQIQDMTFIEKIKSGIISADITKENPTNALRTLKYLDFLFISKEDLFDDVKTIGKKTRGWVIAHDPLGSIYSNGDIIGEYFIPKEDILNNINVLGAGDFFAACFISEFLKSSDIEVSIKNSHKKTTNLLRL